MMYVIVEHHDKDALKHSYAKKMQTIEDIERASKIVQSMGRTPEALRQRVYDMTPLRIRKRIDALLAEQEAL